MRLQELEKHVLKRLKNTNEKIDIPITLYNDVLNNKYDKLMKFFGGFCFIRKGSNCSDKKQSYDSKIILREKVGKCGSLSQLCFHILRQCNKEVYFVAGNFDHAWCIVKHNNRYISLDPSDRTINNWHYTTPDRRMRSIYAWNIDLDRVDVSDMYTITKR